MNGEIIDALEQIEREKGIPMESLLETLEAALASAYRKNFGEANDIRIEVDRRQHRVRIFSRRPKYPPPEPEEPEAEVAESGTEEAEPEEGVDTALALALAEAQRSQAQLAEVATATEEEVAVEEPEIEYIEEEVSLDDFGRIAAQTAKQVFVQRTREAERELIYDEFSQRIGEVVTGEVQRKDARNVFISLGRVESVLPPHEQIPGENCRFNERLKVYIQEVRKTTKNPQVVVSRTHPMLVKRLFELEVPEVEDGIVELKSVAREPGARSKVAVWSRDEQVDPVGACVGARGARVQTIVDELRGEKVDIVRWSDDIKQYLASALSPARVAQVVPDPDSLCATVVVPDDQLSLAIGRRGQNVRLAARLTGWKIDIRSQGQYREQERLVQEASARAAMPRVRVHQLAKELDVPTMELLEVLEEEGIKATTHASSISGHDAERVRQLLAGAGPA